MSRLEVLFIGGSFPMPKAGGSINYVSHLLTGIDDLPYVVLTADLDHEKNQEYDKQFGHRVIRSKLIAHVLDQNPGNFFKRNLILLLSIFQAAWIIVKLRPRFVYYTEYTFLTLSFYLARPFIKSKLGLFTYAEEIQLVLKKPLHFHLLKKVLKDSYSLITVCEFTQNMLSHIIDGIKDKTAIIIPPVKVPNQKPEKVNLDRGQIRLLTVARLEERKGHIDVLEVIHKLLPKYPDIHYSIVGKGNFEKEIRDKISELSLDAYVEMKGRVSDEDLEKEYDDADIFVMPHKQLNNGDTEGCPTVFLEAGLHLLPVVGGEAGGVSDAIKDGKTGYICHVGTDELYIYLDRLMRDASLRKDMGESGFRYASCFSIKDQAKKFRTIISNNLG